MNVVAGKSLSVQPELQSWVLYPGMWVWEWGMGIGVDCWAVSFIRLIPVFEHVALQVQGVL